MPDDKIKPLIDEILDRRVLKRAVFSKIQDKNILRVTAAPVEMPDGSVSLRVERFTRDNKAYQENRPYGRADCADCADLLYTLARSARQVNIFTTAGDLELLRSKSDNIHISGRLDKTADVAAAQPHNDKKNYILDPSRDSGFLYLLGLADKNGRIHDKKQAKFRQINRFLELLFDIVPSLPTDRAPVIYDLCCGKNYLTFAVYYYFTKILGREVHMHGVDLKPDVVSYGAEVARRQGFENLDFTCGDVAEYDPPEPCDLVISLHACDIATDIVLFNAIRWRARAIMSTPCCHHEMARQLPRRPDSSHKLRGELEFILKSPILRQKFCDIATDALRAKRLESRGYSVETLELIDPDETPKNVMIRARLRDNPNPDELAAALDEYRRLCGELGVSPYLDRLLTENEN